MTSSISHLFSERCTVFISDLHIDHEKPDITKQFINFCEEILQHAKTIDALYILGDWFESWVGDDDPDADKWMAIEVVKKIDAAGINCFFMAGNRDFLVGDIFSEKSGCKILPDPSIVSLYGKSVALMHGDTLCTDDIEYQKFRQMARSAEWQEQIKALPLEQRIGLAAQIRAESQSSMQDKSNDIMDVNQNAVMDAFKTHQIDTIIHGHTHRPAIHKISKEPIDNVDQIKSSQDLAMLTRVVLGDWYEQGSVLVWRKKKYELITLAR